MLKILPDWRGMKNKHMVEAIHALATGPIVEPFGGTGIVSLNGNGVTYNELDQRIIRLAVELRDNMEGFIDECQMAPKGFDYGKSQKGYWWAEGNEYVENFSNPPTPVQTAWFSAHCFAGRMSGRAHPSGYRGWNVYLAKVPSLSRRLNEIEITSMDALDCIERQPSGRTIYADPPCGSSGVYRHSVSDGDLVDALDGHDGTVILSGYGEAPMGWRSIQVTPAGRSTVMAQGYQKKSSNEFLAWRKA